ncbi:MAG TPA: antibiotic biosynthesis monooxygenase [Anaerolineae bacterium]|nr:antibiotic biosynthesis monooxygenase [Anaerolineae bacterium]
MFIVQVHVLVKKEFIKEFLELTKINARCSEKEPGIARFDVLQQLDKPSQFILVEVYRTEKDPAKHKETQHYKEWREKVHKMMAEPRQSIKYVNIFPLDPD